MFQTNKKVSLAWTGWDQCSNFNVLYVWAWGWRKKNTFYFQVNISAGQSFITTWQHDAHMSTPICIFYLYCPPFPLPPTQPFSPAADIYTLQECVSLAFNVKDLKDALSCAGKPAAKNLTYIKKKPYWPDFIIFFPHYSTIMHPHRLIKKMDMSFLLWNNTQFFQIRK